jgi:REP element-mobilizing transposase RayT
MSDHFFTFIVPPGRLNSPLLKHPSVLARNYSLANMNKFRNDLAVMDWTCVTNCYAVDEAYSIFWNTYKACHDTNFPLKRSRFNKNFHKIQQFMTAGLLISRTTKNHLHKLSLTDPSVVNLQKYKNYKTIYFRVLRGAKKIYFKNKINENIGNPKKTWDTLNEIMGKAKKKDVISQININDVTVIFYLSRK